MTGIEDNVCAKIQKRAEVGFKKYGVGITRTDFSFLKWLQYLQEELMDASIYLERIMEEIKEND